ncbi:MAG: substrate-binding domain-containing protein [Cyclobacteriaceae bacterium]|nr:substrate-binding domain-containing protein [Cyclobacteriaceae bacterium]
MSKKIITIRDIARLAEVSEGTVDRVLHNRGRVGENSLKKVMKVLNEFNYKPNMIARSLSISKSYKLAILMTDPTQDSYWAQSQSGVRQALAEWEQYGITIEPFFFDGHNGFSFERVAKALLNASPDGVLIAPIFYQEALSFFRSLNDKQIPYVLFNTKIAEAKPLCFIGQDLYNSGMVAAELMDIGQSEACLFAILHIYEDLNNSVHLVEKERGFRFYFSNSGQKHKITTIRLGNPDEPSFEDQLSSLLSDSQLKGLFVSTSTVTSSVAEQLEKHKREDIRLIGYDLLEGNLRYLESGTITFLINQNPRHQAFLSIDQLAKNLLFKKTPPASSLLPLDIITKHNLDSYLSSVVH